MVFLSNFLNGMAIQTTSNHTAQYCRSAWLPQPLALPRYCNLLLIALASFLGLSHADAAHLHLTDIANRSRRVAVWGIFQTQTSGHSRILQPIAWVSFSKQWVQRNCQSKSGSPFMPQFFANRPKTAKLPRIARPKQSLKSNCVPPGFHNLPDTVIPGWHPKKNWKKD